MDIFATFEDLDSVPEAIRRALASWSLSFFTESKHRAIEMLKRGET